MWRWSSLKTTGRVVRRRAPPKCQRMSQPNRLTPRECCKLTGSHAASSSTTRPRPAASNGGLSWMTTRTGSASPSFTSTQRRSKRQKDWRNSPSAWASCPLTGRYPTP
ncbi:hypothetical protein B0T14DRAFT_148401 [Immersiella caudata]|uniref:Uncharacterized protein n=1 Tax=Immersiella caudata TaxID=314043 RepID=A0AA39WVJ8_9PEZI|nr:hypothetical protein B0T14DRAFT_148401 [Immersiella caudata]